MFEVMSGALELAGDISDWSSYYIDFYNSSKANEAFANC